MLVLSLIITGCGAVDKKTSNDSLETDTAGVTSTNMSGTSEGSSSIEGDVSYLDKNNFKNKYTSFSFSDKSVYPDLFISNGTSIVFPNWDDNNNISVINDPLPDGTINTSMVNYFVNYPTYSLAVVKNVVYFADGSKKHSLASVDLSSKAYTPVIVDSNAKSIIADKEVIYFINGKKDNILQSYDTVEKTSNTVCFDNVGTYFVNGNFVIYQNKSDGNRLYKINIDGTQKEQLTEFSVDSFAKYENKIVAINSSDNNNLYSISLENLDTQRLAVINGENLKESQEKLYFIDINNNRHLSSIDINNSGEQPKVTITDISKESVNNYYVTDKGIFVQRAANVNNGYALLKNK